MTTLPKRTMTSTENQVHDNPEVVTNEEVSSSNNIDPDTQSSSQSALQLMSTPNSITESVTTENVDLIVPSSQNVQASRVHESLNELNLSVFLNGRYRRRVRIPHIGIVPTIPIRIPPRIPPTFETIIRKHTGNYKEFTNCIICFEDNAGNSILKPCKHGDFCDICLRKLEAWTCPICRSDIKQICVFV